MADAVQRVLLSNSSPLLLCAGFAGSLLENGAVNYGVEWEWRDYDELLAFALHKDTPSNI